MQIGVVQLGITLNNVKKEIDSALRRILFLSFVILLIGVFLAWLLSNYITRPVNKVVRLLNDISAGEGDLSQRGKHDPAARWA